MNVGIYQILNLITNDVYIGSSRNFKSRKEDHFCALKRNRHHSIILQRAYVKYGKENFVCTLIEECDINNLLVREQFYIDKLNPKYNISKIAGRSGIAKGWKHTEETKKRISKSHKGLNTWMKGTKASPETIAKRAAKIKGKKYPWRWGIPSWNKGIPFNKEVRHKMSVAKKGKLWTEEKKIKHTILISKYRPMIIRNDGKIYINVTDAAKEIGVKDNTIIKSISDKKVNRKVKGYKFAFYKTENKTKMGQELITSLQESLESEIKNKKKKE